MPSFSTKRHVPFSAAQMFAVAADVERYPEFLPLCTGLTVLTRQPVEAGSDGDTMLTARMTVGYKSISEAFTTRVLLKPSASAIDVSYLDGPFSYLDNRWRFVDRAPSAGGGSDIDFYISYAFKSPMLGLLVGSMFDGAFRKFAEAFERRAEHVYGTARAPYA
ncbi:MAG: type II toxin-antitoxin system RatA family toxin [Hyphomicrobium sp.]